MVGIGGNRPTILRDCLERSRQLIRQRRRRFDGRRLGGRHPGGIGLHSAGSLRAIDLPKVPQRSGKRQQMVRAGGGIDVVEMFGSGMIE